MFHWEKKANTTQSLVPIYGIADPRASDARG
jgi:hypothetical protein